MPQLGMAQDSGVILSWLKSAGDKVEADEILMEIETDKATVEVEAGASGIVAALRAEAGAEIAVGEIVALIETDADSHAVEGGEAAGPLAEPDGLPRADEDTPTTKSEPRPRETPLPPAKKHVPHAPGGVLASPKARYLAKTRDIDLRRLVRSGVPEPIHAADVRSAAKPATGSEEAVLAAAASEVGLNAMLELAGDDGVEIERSAALAAFAAAAFRSAKGIDGIVSVELVTVGLDVSRRHFSDPDRAGLLKAAASGAAEAAGVVVYDLTGTRFDDYRPGGESGIPSLTVSRSLGGDTLHLRLRFTERDMPLPFATAFLDGFASRLENPVRHIL